MSEPKAIPSSPRRVAFAFGGRYVRRLENNVPTFAAGEILRDYHIGEKTTESVLTPRQVQTLSLKIDSKQLATAFEGHAARIKEAVDEVVKDHALRLHRRITTGSDDETPADHREDVWRYALAPYIEVPNRLAGAWINSEGDAV